MARVALVTSLVCLLIVPARVRAQALIPGPGASGYDAALADRIDDYSRVQDAIASMPVGFGLEAHVADPADRAVIQSFVDGGSRDFVAATGMHPYEVVDGFGEQGDLGMFGGVQAAGIAWRYVVLRDHGGTTAEVDAARASLLRAIEGLHWITAVTGVPGGVVRGIMRITPEGSDPAIPGLGAEFTTLPLLDASGHPQPADKTPTWRDDSSGSLPFLIWLDDTSKDQMDGYVIALGAVYDAIVGDPTIDQTLVERLRTDCAAIGRRLLEPVDVGGGHMADLVIVDADGRPTSFHDLSAEEVTPGVVVTRPLNGFNALMALGILRTLYHVSGDDMIGQFYYQTLVGDRDYLTSAMNTVRGMYAGAATNYSNVNMAFVAAYGVLRYETDPTIQMRVRDILETQMYAPGIDREARGLALPYFDVLYAGFRTGGATDAAGMQAMTDALGTLGAYPAAPIWEPVIQNCDTTEIAAGSCLGIDGTTTITLLPDPGHGGSVVAEDVVPLAIRPHSDFEHRSDPHRVNGGGSSTLDPAGDMVAAYWLGRMLDRAGGTTNVSANARAPLPWTPASARDAGVRHDAGTDAAAEDAGTAPPASASCGCRASGRGGASSALLVLAALFAMRRAFAMKGKRVATSKPS